MKQRLIDANKLMPNAKLKGQYDLVSARDIANQPTIEAIPIEWLKKEILERAYARCFRWEDIEHKVDSEMLIRAWSILIDNWEKENATE